MFLKKIEIQGFKSFADKTVIELPSSITTVIGPNGSGKSNVVDSIRWVLGEQSMKSLRGHKSEDIIFAGTQARKPIGFAEVNLYIDNGKGILPIEYEEVVITRRLYRSGESEYLINKTQCRLKDIQQLFLNTGVGKEGYSIIGQGKVEEILNSKSEDRRYMFEEAAGILKYRYRKNEAEKKLENTRTNLIRVTDIIKEIDGRLETLCVQSEKAKQYLNYRDELKSKEISLFNFNMQKGNKAIDELEEKLKIGNEQIQGKQKELANLQEEKVQTKNIVEELFNKQEEIQQFVFTSDNTIEKLNSEIAMLEVQKQNNIENYDVLEKEIIELQTMIKTNEEEKKNRRNKIDLLIANKKRFEDELNEKQLKYDEMYSKLSEKGEEIEAKKDFIEEEHEKVINLKMEINNLKKDNENGKVNYSKLEKEEREKISEKDAKKLEKEEFDNILNEKLKLKEEFDNKINEFKEKQEQINNKIDTFNKDIDELTQEFRTKNARYTFLCEIQREREGYAKAVKEILLNTQKDKEFANGVEGSVADIISTPKEYEVAIEMALGGYLQNIVTLDQESAKKCIEYLKKNKFGRASFLPISAVKSNKTNGIDKISKEKGFVGLASDLVKYNEKYKEIIVNLLGKTIIVETIEDGINISKKHGSFFKLVTLDGDVISTTGQMSGGSIEKKTSSILGRNKEIEQLEKDIKKIEEKIKLENKKKEDFENNIDLGSINYIELNEKSNAINIDYATSKQRVDMINSEIENISSRIEKIRREKEEILQNEKARSEKIILSESEIETIEKQIEEIKNEIQEYSNLYKDEQLVIDDLKDEITNLKISISSFDESNVSYEDMIAMIDSEIEKANANIIKKQEQKEKMLKENEEFAIKDEECKKQIEEVAQKRENIAQTIEQVKIEKDDKNKLLDVIDKNIEDTINEISLLNTDVSKIESKKIRVEDELEELKTKMVEEYEIPLEQLINQEEQVLEPTKVQKEINVLRKNIKDLGNVNVEAIEEYKESKERFDFLATQRDDLEGTEAKLKKLINEITVIMKEQFRNKFKLINEAFGEVFVKLFGGGKAEVKLTDENDILNCGVEIEAQPPGKKLQNITLLSGGEKALTAIALLFGIFKTNPSPFCILDEIEAALDDINVFRFAQYVKEYTENTQFLMITHRKGTMEIAETLYGVTMQEQGVTKLVSMKM